MKKITFLALAVVTCTLSQAQTFKMVYNLFQANCTVGCHNSSFKEGNLDLSASSAKVYSALVNVNPVNPAAVKHGDKLIVPGDPHHSFLLRKCNRNLDTDNNLKSGEGGVMPDNKPALKDQDIELIRQWILYGAQQNDNLVDTSLINKYYAGKALPEVTPPPPAAGAVRVHLGKIFLAPNAEAEYFIKHHITFPDTVEVNRLNLQMASQSHHFIIYKFLPGAQSGFSEGLRLQDPQSGANSSNGNNTMVNAWQTPLDVQLPAGTAYLWEKGTVLDLNYHIHNDNPDSVLGAEVYFDVFTQPKTKPVQIMYSELITNTDIAIPNDKTDHTFTKAFFDKTDTSTWNIWLLSSHTHKYGKDFDIFLRNPDGTAGTQIFEGWFDTKYKFNQGYYSWEHPPVEIFQSMLPVKVKDGLIQKAVFNNDGPNPVSFGLTTKDEMMLFFVQYTINEAPYVSGITEKKADEYKTEVYPNPFSGFISISGKVEKPTEIKTELLDMMGRQVITPVFTKVSDHYKFDINLQQFVVPGGFYLCRITAGDHVEIHKLIK